MCPVGCSVLALHLNQLCQPITTASPKSFFPSVLPYNNPAGTWHRNDVVQTSMTSVRRHVPDGKMIKHGDSASEHYSVCFVFQTELVKALMSLAIFSYSHNGVRKMLKRSPFGQWVKRRLAKLVVRQAGCGNLYRSMTFRQKCCSLNAIPRSYPNPDEMWFKSIFGGPSFYEINFRII